MLRFASLLFVSIIIGCGPGDASFPKSDGSGEGAPEAQPHAPIGSTPTAPSTSGTKEVLISGLDLSERSGNLRLFLTDEPAEYDAVWVTISRTELQVGEGSEQRWVTVVDAPAEYDLLQLRNDVTAVMGDASLAPGHYGQMRMIVADAAVEKDGIRTPLFIPSGEQTGIKINLSLQVQPDTQYVLVTDFDAARSIKKTGRGLLMEPVLAVELIGTVDAEGNVTPSAGYESLPVEPQDDESADAGTSELPDAGTSEEPEVTEEQAAPTSPPAAASDAGVPSTP